MATAAHRRSSPRDGGGLRAASRRVHSAGAAVAAAALVAGLFAACGGQPRAAGTARHHHAAPTHPASTTTTAPPHLTVASVRPAPWSRSVPVDAAITISFSAPLAGTAPRPILDPPVAGEWVQSGATLTFHPTGGFVPSTQETVTIPAGVAAVERGRNVTLTTSYRASFEVTSGSFLRLQELLSELRYLPFTFTPSAPVTTASYETAASSTTTGPSSTSTSSTATSTPSVPPTATPPTTATSSDTTTAPPTTDATTTTTTAPTPTTTLPALEQEPTSLAAVRTAPIPGRFTWAYRNIPGSLVAAWSSGKDNVLTRGAVMAFEANNGLAVDGVAGPEVWTTLRRDIALRKVDPHPYNYLMVNESGTEYLKVWSDGQLVYTSLANTGVRGATTQPGIFPVFSRFEHTMMKGTDVDGTKYDVPVSWVAYFNGGDAVHGYPRPGYGYPQSNGCVELPIPNAEMLWSSSQGYDGYGVLVDVSSGPAS